MSMTDEETHDALERLMRAAPVSQQGRAALRTGRNDRLEYTNTPQAAPSWSLADEGSVQQVVEEQLFNDDERIWETLTGEGHVIATTHRALANFKRELQQQLQARRVKADSLYAECRAAGASRKQEWLTWSATYEDWRRRAVYVDNRIAKLIAYVRDRRRVVNVAHNQGINQRAWEALAKAIAAHRASNAPDRDAQLYAVLDTVEVRGSSIAEIMSRWTW